MNVMDTVLTTLIRGLNVLKLTFSKQPSCFCGYIWKHSLL